LARRKRRGRGKKSTLQRMRGASLGLIALALLAAYSAYQSFGTDQTRAGFEFAGAAIGLLAFPIAFTLPVQCRVATTSGNQCRRWAYGVLLGCRDVPGHMLGKFLVRLGLHPKSARPAVARTSGPAIQVQADVASVVLTVADGGGGASAFWFGLIGTAAGVASFALAVAELH